MSEEELLLFNDIYNQTQHFGRTQFVREIMKLQKENKILRENAEHNDKVVDKVNWENQKLKKELEEYKRLDFEHLNDKCNKLENQQKEFIEYLEKTIVDSKAGSGQQYYFQVILSKYKEIIGSDSE